MPGLFHSNVPICFVTHTQADKWPDLLRGEWIDVDSNPGRFRSGVDVWVAQTFLRTAQDLERETGKPVLFTDRFVPGQICIAHRDDLNNFRVPFHSSYVIGIRADRPPLFAANAVVIQNPLEEGLSSQRFIPLWPQPGLVKRDATRGNTVTRIGYLGRASSAPGWFFDRDFHAALRDLGSEFVIREKEWQDYSDLDAVLAYRDEAPTMLAHKPATKLYNAWLAEVPALLGPEPAYRAAQRSELDFIEVSSPEDVISALRAMKETPGRFEAMVQNGRLRAAEYTVDAIRAKWVRFLTTEIVADFHAWQKNRYPVGREACFYFGLLRQKLASERFKARLERELDAVK